jgi:hypothetical protein
MEGRETPEPIVMPGAISRALKASIPQSQREWGGAGTRVLGRRNF